MWSHYRHGDSNHEKADALIGSARRFLSLAKPIMSLPSLDVMRFREWGAEGVEVYGLKRR